MPELETMGEKNRELEREKSNFTDDCFIRHHIWLDTTAVSLKKCSFGSVMDI